MAYPDRQVQPLKRSGQICWTIALVFVVWTQSTTHVVTLQASAFPSLLRTGRGFHLVIRLLVCVYDLLRYADIGFVVTLVLSFPHYRLCLHLSHCGSWILSDMDVDQNTKYNAELGTIVSAL